MQHVDLLLPRLQMNLHNLLISLTQPATGNEDEVKASQNSNASFVDDHEALDAFMRDLQSITVTECFSHTCIHHARSCIHT